MKKQTVRAIVGTLIFTIASVCWTSCGEAGATLQAPPPVVQERPEKTGKSSRLPEVPGMRGSHRNKAAWFAYLLMDNGVLYAIPGLIQI